MRKLAALAGVAALGLSTQTAFGYGGTADVAFTFGGSVTSATADQGFVSSGGPVSIASLSNTTMFSQTAGSNSLGTYNSDFADTTSCNAAIPPGATLNAVRQYGCRYNSGLFVGVPIVDGGPLMGATATGTLTLTDTTLTGVLQLIGTTDEPTGVTTVTVLGARIATTSGAGTNGYNYRTADGSPFGSAWYGTTTAGTLTVNLTGSFTDTAWSITGGYVDYSDSGFACQQGGFGGDARGTLCTASGTGGGFANDGGHLSWGMDADGGLTTPGNNPTPGMITVRDQANAVLTQLSGAIASLTLDASGNLTTTSGEFRRGSGSGQGCASFVTYNTITSQLTCGSITSGALSLSGVSHALVPVPAAVWMLGSALGLLGFIRRKVAA